MHFLDAWTGLPLLDLARLAPPVAFLLLAALVPGHATARFAALGIAVAVPFLPEVSPLAALRAAWALLWLAVAWQAGRGTDRARSPAPARFGGLESGTIGLLLAPLLLVVLVGAVARLDLPADATRRASYGASLLCLGLLHLMLRRHALRSAIAFAALGLGLQVLEGAARAGQLAGDAAPAAAVLLATALAVALVVRVARGRERHAGSAWVNDAHDLHD
ncbi:MAG: hypothetical protein HZC42_09210 [Candidatus Eisenbacteria bacterium]|nr:hypothetical protein [Candidatus Eisenbacteria bacterium]